MKVDIDTEKQIRIQIRANNIGNGEESELTINQLHQKYWPDIKRSHVGMAFDTLEMFKIQDYEPERI